MFNQVSTKLQTKFKVKNSGKFPAEKVSFLQLGGLVFSLLTFTTARLAACADGKPEAHRARGGSFYVPGAAPAQPVSAPALVGFDFSKLPASARCDDLSSAVPAGGGPVCEPIKFIKRGCDMHDAAAENLRLSSEVAVLQAEKECWLRERARLVYVSGHMGVMDMVQLSLKNSALAVGLNALKVVHSASQAELATLRRQLEEARTVAAEAGSAAVVAKDIGVNTDFSVSGETASIMMTPKTRTPALKPAATERAGTPMLDGTALRARRDSREAVAGSDDIGGRVRAAGGLT